MISEKLLYISMSLEKSNYGGSIVSRANLKALKANERLQVKELAIVRKEESSYAWEVLAKSSKIQTALNNLRGYAGRLNAEIFRKIKEIIEEYQPTTLYLDSSLLGSVAEWCKSAYPAIKILTFFHNAEVDFEKDRLKSGKIQYLPSLFSTATAEKKAVKYSDVLVALHEADSDRLLRLYKRKADFCVPVCIVDERIDDEVLYGTEAAQSRPFTVGFIGTAFYANTEAAQYISQHIAPAFIDDSQIQFVIAGNGFEAYATKLDKPNLKTYGFVESLADFYQSIDVILSPISVGGGMKVKVAEALKYNKKVIASPFTLIGYEQSLACPDIISCSSLDEYKVAIQKLKDMRTISSTTRTLFLQYYSDSACAEYFKKIFQ
ncbi:glycosyltransferase family 4 protein [Enterobacter bugandensis]|uniref:glycosyltransferase family 4 protein n=1 Tax=Enterobacter bugandensis TaxID=881260 RepID=UPI001E6406C7|nr:glycosyltransferase family 4 protein [Enterobacter bugandensis]MCE1393535.1 glycosyltransferase family 4 protein [Enterobacter bugandensis]MCK6697305.1 glycosyltransferase family 4 protein [Enterobacter bugandensis]MCK6860678.1 glycosyltransferase family 4 protein [Enterobacter bugandensis]MCK7065797.1 glycosyltransferase family 4 protein [Enterobacter bugandensis]MCK7146318.1 glycosyltransferase family 4 protein [Enterobacter bugandensis]